MLEFIDNSAPVSENNEVLCTSRRLDNKLHNKKVKP